MITSLFNSAQRGTDEPNRRSRQTRNKKKQTSTDTIILATKLQINSSTLSRTKDIQNILVRHSASWVDHSERPRAHLHTTLSPTPLQPKTIICDRDSCSSPVGTQGEVGAVPEQGLKVPIQLCDEKPGFSCRTLLGACSCRGTVSRTLRHST